jgi:xylulokinase
MICGGGAKSWVWKKIFANVLGIELTIPETEQGPGYGGAILAAVGNQEYPSVQAAVDQLIKVTDTVKPDPELQARYDERYTKVYRTLYPTLKDTFQLL